MARDHITRISMAEPTAKASKKVEAKAKEEVKQADTKTTEDEKKAIADNTKETVKAKKANETVDSEKKD